jgi:eukaryotic-like serine/threonine-protein kinase
MLTLVVGKELDGRYVVQDSIGSGAYGTVWKASDKQLNGNVALKRPLKDGRTSASEDFQRLISEASRHAQLVHTNIVQVFDFIEC